MGLTSLHVCMDSVDWLQGAINEETGMDSSSPSEDMLACARPLIERRLRPPHDQDLKCPRCESTHTKFCYYNNYSLSQPRYFCKTCRRYWTKGGTLRNIPVGGGCRKNKKVSNTKSSKPNELSSASSDQCHPVSNQTELQLSFPDQVQLSHLNSIINNPASYMDGKYGTVGLLQENPSRAPVVFLESKWNSHDFMGNAGHVLDHHHHHLGSMINGVGGDHHNHMTSTHHGLAPSHHGNFGSSAYGMMISSLEGGSSGGAAAPSGTNFMETCQRLMLPYQGDDNMDDDPNGIDVKPNPKLLSLEWQDQGCYDGGNKDTFGNNYVNNLGPLWTGMMINTYGPSTTNPLV